ncbi:MAG: methyltransferase [Rhodobacter sp.]|nr:methyltransferase [Rhodobacter sp.]
MKDVFERIYRTDHWKGGSGEGSAYAPNKPYVAFLQAFLARRRVRSVVDLGCGDWQFSQHIDWRGVAYDGFDLVDAVQARNRAAFGSATVRFHAAVEDWDALPAADLLIAKDVLQHWSNARIAAFLPVLERYPAALITNCIGDYGPPLNSDVKDGAFRPLDIRRSPFAVAAEEVLRYGHVRRRFRVFGKDLGWQKAVLLVEGAG